MTARASPVARAGQGFGPALVAAGDVHMHVRSRKALQDTLTAIRLARPCEPAATRFIPQRRAASEIALAPGADLSAGAARRNRARRRALQIFSG